MNVVAGAATGDGGAVYLESGDITFTDGQVGPKPEFNEAMRGPGFFLLEGTLDSNKCFWNDDGFVLNGGGGFPLSNADAFSCESTGCVFD